MIINPIHVSEWINISAAGLWWTFAYNFMSSSLADENGGILKKNHVNKIKNCEQNYYYYILVETKNIEI